MNFKNELLKINFKNKTYRVILNEFMRLCQQNSTFNSTLEDKLSITFNTLIKIAFDDYKNVTS